MAVDLHVHSTASDGSVPPSGLVAMGLQLRLQALALTDHDTQSGWTEAAAAAEGTELELIPGVELSLDYEGGGMHLLVLWLEPGEGPLQDRLVGLQAGRDTRNARIVDALNDAGLSLTVDQVLEESGGGSVGRPHIAAVLVSQGHVPDIRTAFDLWLARGRPAYFDRPRMDPAEAIALARESRGVPILAHPHTLGVTTAEKMARTLTELREHGLVGLEAVYAAYRRHERDGYAHLARRFGLVPTGGSDFHGTYKDGLELGYGYGDLSVGIGLLDELREHRP